MDVRPDATERGRSPSRRRASCREFYRTANPQHRSAAHRPRAKALERLVGVLERMLLDMGPHGYGRRELHELLAVAAGEVWHPPHHSLAPEDLVPGAGGVAHVDARTDERAGHAQGAVADQPGAEQRRRLRVRVLLRDREAEALVGDGQLGVAAVDVVPGEARVVAQVLAPGSAVAAVAVGPAEPGHAHPVAG